MPYFDFVAAGGWGGGASVFHKHMSSIILHSNTLFLDILFAAIEVTDRQNLESCEVCIIHVMCKYLLILFSG